MSKNQIIRGKRIVWFNKGVARDYVTSTGRVVMGLKRVTTKNGPAVAVSSVKPGTHTPSTQLIYPDDVAKMYGDDVIVKA